MTRVRKTSVRSAAPMLVSLVLCVLLFAYLDGSSPYLGTNELSGEPGLLVNPPELLLQVGSKSSFNVSYSRELQQDAIVCFNTTGAMEGYLRLDNPCCTISRESLNGCSIYVSALHAHQNVYVVLNYSSIDNVATTFVTVNIVQNHVLSVATVIIGWIYFVAWSVSFYPQIYENWTLKSVCGLDFNFIALNLTGFICYSVFNCAFYWSEVIRQVYFDKNPFGVIPVQPNDIFFGLHAVLATTIVIVQCSVYKRTAAQRVARTCLALLIAFAVFASISLGLALSAKITWLMFIQLVSYIKLTITLLKYIPQAYYNYRRKSTAGWSIGNILLDFTGGSFSLLQLFLDAYNYNDFKGIFEDFTKFGLGAISLCFDILFILQHYVLYRQPRLAHSSDSTSPIASFASENST